jgi:hypothetical protein
VDMVVCADLEESCDVHGMYFEYAMVKQW